LPKVLGKGILDERSSIRKAIVTGQRVEPSETVLVIGDRQRDVLLGVTPLRDGYLLSLADVTQLKEVDRLKSDIVANVSHEFRTPLAIIKAYAELLMDDQEETLAASRHEFLAIIDAETDRLAAMVSGLLDLARLEASAGAIAMSPVRIGDILDEAVALLQPEAQARDIVVNVDMPSELSAMRGNRDLLLTLMRNLLGNAIKFSYDGGRVAVRVRQDDHSLILQVTDQGIGIAEDDKAHLFEKFYRGSTAKNAGIRGTGLGLVLIKAAVEAHHGTIDVESELGRGTSFTVSLPVSNGSEPADGLGYADSASSAQELFGSLALPVSANSFAGA
jgi:two-component system phosphate regulon sensor histidine kinase PhoR